MQKEELRMRSIGRECDGKRKTQGYKLKGQSCKPTAHEGAVRPMRG